MKKIAPLLLMLFALNGFSQNWKSSFEMAKTEAKANNKKIILVFSGSDWCAPCIKLDRNVWQSAEFKTFSDENYVLYKADFPKKKANQLPVELKNQNVALAEKYNKNGNYPLVIILDSNAKILGTMGYKNTSAEAYIKELQSL